MHVWSERLSLQDARKDFCKKPFTNSLECDNIIFAERGALAQLVAHNTGSVGVRSSNLLCSTKTGKSEPSWFGFLACRKSPPAAAFCAKTRFPCAFGAAGETCKETWLGKASESTAHVSEAGRPLEAGNLSRASAGCLLQIEDLGKAPGIRNTLRRGRREASAQWAVATEGGKATRRSQPKRAVGAASARRDD